jgi:predicted transcriptional regulator
MKSRAKKEQRDENKLKRIKVLIKNGQVSLPDVLTAYKKLRTIAIKDQNDLKNYYDLQGRTQKIVENLNEEIYDGFPDSVRSSKNFNIAYPRFDLNLDLNELTKSQVKEIAKTLQRLKIKSKPEDLL